MPTVIISDEIDPGAVAELRRHLEVQEAYGVGQAELSRIVSDADALIVRSGTRVTAEIINAGRRLKIIGRAGTGVDNIDVEAATERGIWVVNAPNSNANAVAEHVLGLMLALSRKVPWAWQSVWRGEWKRGAFRGRELAGKTLGVIGLGRIGRAVAAKGLALGMSVCGHDPFLSPERAKDMGVRLLPLEDVLARSDYTTVHVPGGPATAKMIGATELRLCKPGSYLVNCSRGTVIDEEALLDALDRGTLAGAALDVFAEEPPGNMRLVRHPKVIATPHIAGMTEEAQRDVALSVARQVIDVLAGNQPSNPVNAPALTPEQQQRLGPYLGLARRLGTLCAQILVGPVSSIHVTVAGAPVDSEPSLIAAAVLEGLLSHASVTPVNIVNARLVARNRGIAVGETIAPQPNPFASLVSVKVTTEEGDQTIDGTIMHGMPYVVRVHGFWITFVPAGRLLYTEHVEQPGILGRMGTLLGDAGINISFLQVGRHSRGGRGVMIVGVDDNVSEATLEAIRNLPSVLSARRVMLPPV